MSAEDDGLWEVLSYVQMSKNRKLVLKELDESRRPLTPTELSRQLNIAFNSASRALRQLAGKGLVVCINPDAPRYRRYRMTSQGKRVWKELRKLDPDRE